MIAFHTARLDYFIWIYTSKLPCRYFNHEVFYQNSKFCVPLWPMASVTHLVLGAAIGEVVLGKKLGYKAAIIGALADTVPDFDMCLAIFFTTMMRY